MEEKRFAMKWYWITLVAIMVFTGLPFILSFVEGGIWLALVTFPAGGMLFLVWLLVLFLHYASWMGRPGQSQ